MAAFAPVGVTAATAPSIVPDLQPDFRTLLGPAAWAQLPAAVQARFLPHAAEVVYAGDMRVEASPVGWLMAQACRLIGRPLATATGDRVPVSVRVWAEPRGALVWDRTYAFAGRRPETVRSRKKADRRGLVEVVRCGLGMRLALSVEDGALHFRSRGYFMELLGIRLPFPSLATPGRAHVVHRDEGGGRFRFTLDFDHPWFGRTIFQDGVFSDPES